MSLFNKEMMQVDDVEEKVIMAALMVRLLPSKFLFSLSKNPPSHMAYLMVKSQQHKNVEDALSARQEWHVNLSSQSDKRKREQQQARREQRSGCARKGNNNCGVRPLINIPPTRFQYYTPSTHLWIKCSCI